MNPHQPHSDPATRAVVLLSGGLDSATVLALARAQGCACLALTVDYGQRHRFELQAARRVADALGAQRCIVAEVGLGQFGGSALTAAIDVPKPGDVGEIGSGIPVTYVPARNTVMLAIALGLAEAEGAGEIHIGANCVDYSGYPDCRPAYFEAFQTLANLATRAGVEAAEAERGPAIAIRTPLLEMSKAEIIRLGVELGVDYSLTHSCYDPDPQGGACGDCEACVLRRRGFREAGVPDPTRYSPRA